MADAPDSLHFPDTGSGGNHQVITGGGGGISVVNPKYADLARGIRAQREQRRARIAGGRR